MLPWWFAVADVSNAPEKANRSFVDSHDCHRHGWLLWRLSTLENQLRHLDLSAEKHTP
jgi:hypothetical protein